MNDYIFITVQVCGFIRLQSEIMVVQPIVNLCDWVIVGWVIRPDQVLVDLGREIDQGGASYFLYFFFLLNNRGLLLLS